MSFEQRLFFFTGKGGVGKSTLSLEFYRHLKKLSHEVLFLNLSPLKSEHEKEYSNFVLEDCARDYIEKKLKSRVVATWITKSSFFKSILNMVPGFSYLVYLGKITEMLDENPKLKIVVDAPASGHMLTLLESAENFKNIFGEGIVYDDTMKIARKLCDKDFTRYFVVSLPFEIAWKEAVELKNELLNRTGQLPTMIVNQILASSAIDGEGVPLTIKKKLDLERKLLSEIKDEVDLMIPHYLTNSHQEENIAWK